MWFNGLESRIVPIMTEFASPQRGRLSSRCARGRSVVAALLMGTGVGVLLGGESQSGLVSSLASREMAKREAQLSKAQSLVLEAGTFFDNGDYTEAMKSDRDAWQLLADSPATEVIKTAARDGYSRAANAQARKLAGEARYAEAEALLNSVLEDGFDPANADTKLFMKQINDPDRFNPALTPQHLRNVADVGSLLQLGNGLLDIGDYDAALEKFQSVLRIDKFNSAARQGMERVEKIKEGYYASARDQTRASLINKVNAAWEEAVPVSLDVTGLFGGQSTGSGGRVASGKTSIVNNLQTWIVPTVDLQGASLEETVEFLRIRSRDLDPRRQGMSFILRVPAETKSKTITLQLARVPLDELLRYVTQMSGTVYRVDEFAVTITSLAEKTTALTSKSWRVQPDFISNAPVGDAPPAALAPPDPFAEKPANGGLGRAKNLPAGASQSQMLHRFGAREFLEQRGVPFPDGSAATYNPSNSILFVTNTVENLALIDEIVEQAVSATPKLVEIRVRILEVDQSQLNELGFDWALGQFSVSGSGGVFASGGTVGSGRDGNFTNQEFPVTGPDHITPIGTNPITAGLRSSGAILGGSPSIDGLLSNVRQVASDARSPGVFSVAGVFTDPQFQVVLRTLSQKKGKDILAAPAVITKSGQRASILVVREFIYPTEFSPPQIPTGGSNANAPVVIAPTTPSAFTKRDVGVVLEVEPVVAADNKSIDVNVAPTLTEFEGFINYGSDIHSISPGGLLFGPVTTNQPNPILQPVFQSIKGASAVTIYDGATIVIAGVITEKRKDINDKVPVIGDLPLVGRAFQSKVSQIERKNLMIFVTARLLDLSGNLINQPAATTAAAP